MNNTFAMSEALDMTNILTAEVIEFETICKRQFIVNCLVKRFTS